MVRINQQDAQARSLTEGDSVFLFNDHGCITRKVHISDDVPPGVLAVYQGGEQPVSNLISNSFTDMVLNNTGSNSVAFYDIYVECKKRR
jgi:anaerobic selenocysteine-containing dehydrogenase